MLKIKKKIPNPMTIIAIFAILSESSAALSLPFLEGDEREIYVWFLISFPFYLLFLFFMTLNFNYRSLYAPSDFETDESFLHVIDIKERDSKPREPGAPTDISSSSPLNLMAQHHISLPEAINELHIIDTRTMTSNTDLGPNLEKIPTLGKRSSQVVIFLAGDVSGELLTIDKLRHSRNPKKGRGMTYFVVYKVCTQSVTVLGKF